ncbi:MAG: right-handed parallel beta-helix repeat-containing protein, partial [Candidatus Stygibacter australis]|nr:right-handed parallel beta-helix repeat-containing protein [Candidatus Stygibacter australis]
MRRVLFFLVLFSSLVLFGQEVYTIDNSGTGDYEDISSAINYLNELVDLPEGGIIFNVTVGQVFNENPPVITVQASEETPIVFQKSGEGENPVIQNTDTVTAMLHFDGAAWITVNGIDIADGDAVDLLRYEKAVYIFASDHISILNGNFSDFDKYGIHVRDASTNTVLDNNEVFYTEPYFTEQTSVYSIYVQYQTGADNVIISNNKVYGIKEASATVYGIRVWKVNAQVYNNFVALTA